jgi:signal transduction histidine kinase
VTLDPVRHVVWRGEERVDLSAKEFALLATLMQHREVLAEGSDEFGWVALDPDGHVTERDAAAPSLGLPKPELAREALREGEAVSATIHGSHGSVRAVSMPMHESGEVVGVIQYARSLQRIQETVNGLVAVVLPLGLGALGLSAVGGLYMAGRAMRPVREAFDRQRAFIADAPHELKTPITLIRADTEMLQRGLSDPDNRELADDIPTETDRMTNTLSDLLLMARLDTGKLAVERKVFDFRAAISEVVDRFAARAATEGVSVKVRAPEEPCFASSCRQREACFSEWAAGTPGRRLARALVCTARLR